MVTEICLHRDMQIILGGGGGGSVIPESLKALQQVQDLSSNYSINVVCVAASPKGLAKHLCSAIEILQKPIKPTTIRWVSSRQLSLPLI